MISAGLSELQSLRPCPCRQQQIKTAIARNDYITPLREVWNDGGYSTEGLSVDNRGLDTEKLSDIELNLGVDISS